jgi:hypothetical protein
MIKNGGAGTLAKSGGVGKGKGKQDDTDDGDLDVEGNSPGYSE